MENELNPAPIRTPTRVSYGDELDILCPIPAETQSAYMSKLGVEVESIVYDPDYNRCSFCPNIRSITVNSIRYCSKCMEEMRHGH